MPRDSSPGPFADGHRAVLLGALVILASHAWGLSRVLPILPPTETVSRSPSSDVLLGALPLPQAADRLQRLAATLPQGAGVVVADASVDAVASAYMVIAMHVWPRPVNLVTCRPTPVVEQFRVPHPVPTPTWRIVLRPGTPRPLEVRTPRAASPAELCAEHWP